MYNVHIFEKENFVKKEVVKEIRRRKLSEINRQSLLPKMVSEHHKRIDHQVLTLISRPIQVHVYRDQQYVPRPEVKELNIVNPSLRLSSNRSQKERIQEEVHKQKILDLVPFSNSASHQFRSQQIDVKKRKNRSLYQYNQRSSVQDKDSGNLPSIKQRIHLNTIKSVYCNIDITNKYLDKQKNKERQKSLQFALKNSIVNTDIIDENEKNFNMKKFNIQKESKEKHEKYKHALKKCGLLPQIKLRYRKEYPR